MYKYFLIVLLAAATTHAQIEPMASRRYVDQATASLATTQHVANAIAAIDFTEHDPAYWREYYYGDPSIMPSPTNWFIYEAIDSGAAWAVTGFDYQEGREDIVLPYEHFGKPVTEIRRYAFSTGLWMDSEIKTLVAGVVKLGAAALSQAKKLTSVTLLRCKIFGASAFYQCSSLTTLHLPSAVSWAEAVFLGCANLKTVVLKNIQPEVVLFTFQQASEELKIVVTDPQAAFPAFLSDSTTSVPVIRPQLRTDALTLNGVTYTELPDIVAATNHLMSIIATPMLQIDGVDYRQYWDTNLLTTAWEPLP